MLLLCSIYCFLYKWFEVELTSLNLHLHTEWHDSWSTRQAVSAPVSHRQAGRLYKCWTLKINNAANNVLRSTTLRDSHTRSDQRRCEVSSIVGGQQNEPISDNEQTVQWRGLASDDQIVLGPGPSLVKSLFCTSADTSISFPYVHTCWSKWL